MCFKVLNNLVARYQCLKNCAALLGPFESAVRSVAGERETESEVQLRGLNMGGSLETSGAD